MLVKELVEILLTTDPDAEVRISYVEEEVDLNGHDAVITEVDVDVEIVGTEFDSDENILYLLEGDEE